MGACPLSPAGILYGFVTCPRWGDMSWGDMSKPWVLGPTPSNTPGGTCPNRGVSPLGGHAEASQTWAWVFHLRLGID